MNELEYYKMMLDGTPCGLCHVALDEKLTILYANQSYYQIYGYTAENAEAQGLQMRSLFCRRTTINPLWIPYKAISVERTGISSWNSERFTARES